MESGSIRRQNLGSWNLPQGSGKAKEEGVSQPLNSAYLLGIRPLCGQSGMPCPAHCVQSEAQRACVGDRWAGRLKRSRNTGRDT